MFASLPIARKIALCFAAIVLSVMAMMAVLFLCNSRIKDAARDSLHAQTVFNSAMTMETAILRQNSQVRGFLITHDEAYLKQYGEARQAGLDAAAELLTLLPDAADQAQVISSRDKIADWRQVWGEPLIAQVRAGDAAGAQARMTASSKTVTMLPVLAPLRALRSDAESRLKLYGESQAQAMSTAVLAMIVGGAAMIAIAVALSMLLGRQLARPVVRMTTAMGDLAAGKLDIVLTDAARGDELGRMSKAVEVFRAAAVGKAQSDAEQQQVLDLVGDALGRLADADLTARLSGCTNAYLPLERNFNRAVEQLSTALETVRACSAGIGTGANEIAHASDDLARRTEQQAASLEETAAAMDEITAMVRESADGAAQADRVVSETKSEAQAGGNVVRQAVEAMDAINRASSEISEIISVIDGIAFQTNLLALNAGVEAARAGDAGRGFAVVASEVRALAQRSADAAHDVKARITASAGHVGRGVTLVGETGQALERIVGRIDEIGALVSGSAAAAAQQSSGLQQVNIAVGEMDSVTQQNAAMVEESTAASRSLSSEADELVRQVSRFRLSAAPSAMAARPVTAAPARAVPAPRAAPVKAVRAPEVRGNLALKPTDEDDWSQF